MNIENLVPTLIAYAKQYPVVAVVIVLVVAVYVWKKPKESFKISIILVILAAVVYAATLFIDSTSKGTSSKEEMINKTRKVIE